MKLSISTSKKEHRFYRASLSGGLFFNETPRVAACALLSFYQTLESWSSINFFDFVGSKETGHVCRDKNESY